MRKVNELQHIANAITPYAVYFHSERSSWLTKEYLNTKLAGTKVYFEARATLDESISVQAPELRAKRQRLWDITLATQDFLRGYLHVAENVGISDNAFSSTRHTIEKATTALTAIDNFISKANVAVPYIDIAKLQVDLASALGDYTSAKGVYDTAVAQLEAEKQEFLQREDQLDDLYYDVTNAIEGALHEDRDILLVLMPWRARKSTIATAETVDATATATVVAS